MIQGASSDAGKSFLVAALCRIFSREGLRVRPFKAQNMSNNAYVTLSGAEIGRAQAVQAFACGVSPEVDMNPVLLKPSGSAGSQVIIGGEVRGVMSYRDYQSQTETTFQSIRESYDRLSASADLVILEGAGSPAEVNLRRTDLANMAMARYARAPVGLAANLEPGGALAALVGTMVLLEPAERQYVKGLILNRLRGKASLLGEAPEILKRETGTPLWGVIPWLEDSGLPDEDSLSFRSSRPKTAPHESLRIGIVDWPTHANFSDVELLGWEKGVRLELVHEPEELHGLDAVILPGSRDVPGDWRWFVESGLRDGLQHYRDHESGDILGLCGGYQILGRRISLGKDSDAATGTMETLGWLPLETEMFEDKISRQCRARDLERGDELSGYEIHHGRSTLEKSAIWMVNLEGETLGGTNPDGRIRGTYLHGYFENAVARSAFLNRLRRRRGLGEQASTLPSLEARLDRIADHVSTCIDMAEVRRVIESGVEG